MANDLQVLQNNVPAHLQNNSVAAARNAGALAGTGGGGVDRISLKQSRFRLVEGGEEVAKLDASALNLVLLRVNDGIAKTYYEKAWNPNQEAEAPTCYSDDGVVPSPNADKPQSRTCAECPQNAWGSKINPNTQAESKACSDAKRIAVMAAGNLLQDNAKVYQLSVPAASLKDFGKYIRQLNALSPAVPYNALVTQVAFDTDATFPKLLFSPVRYLSTEEFNVAEEKFEAEPVKLCAGLADAAAQHARRVATGGAPIPGANPAGAAQQAVRDQGQAQADTLTSPSRGDEKPSQEEIDAAAAKAKEQEVEQQKRAQAEAAAKQAEKEAAAAREAEKQTPPVNTAAADSFGADAAPTQVKAAAPQAETPPTNAADSFGADPTPPPEPQGTRSEEGFGAESKPQQGPTVIETQSVEQAAADGFGTGASEEPVTQQPKPEAKSDLDSVFGEGWDD